MTFPWKKAKSGRFSQLVSDQIRETRRKGGGSPLVVETGFPTSIVDLFVKNKDRLRRPSTKKKNKYTSAAICSDENNSINHHINDNHDFVASPPSPSSPPPPPPTPAPSPMHPLPRAASPLHHRARGEARIVSDGGVVGNCNGVVGGERGVGNDGSGGAEGVDGNRVLLAILRISLVVVLALGTKKFVVGITLSAFLLLLLECIGKYVLRAPVGKMVFDISRIRKANPEAQKGSVRPPMQLDEAPVASCSGLKNQDQQVMSNGIRGSEIGQTQEIEPDKERIDGREVIGMDLKKDMVVLGEGNNGGENGESQKRLSRRARMKSKMKGLVPKRLRKKKVRDLEGEAGPAAAANVAKTNEEEEDQAIDRRDWGCASDLSSMSSVTDDGKLESSYGSDESTKSSINQKEGTKIKQNSGYVALVLIVLVGLVGGRCLALTLTVAWCLVLKSGETLRQYIKVPFFRSPAIQCS